MILAQTLRIGLSAAGLEVSIAPLESAEAVLASARALRPQVVLLDLDLGGAIGEGTPLVAPLSGTDAAVVMLSGTSATARIAACIDQGAVGYLAKTSSLEEVTEAVRSAANGEVLIGAQDKEAFRAALAAGRQDIEALGRLTPREAQILRLVMAGRSVAEIASGSFVSEGTVRTQIRSILAKLGVKSQLAAVALARRAGWET